MKNFVQPGENLTLPAPAAVVSGQLVKVGSIVGVAAETVAQGFPVDLVTVGVFDLAKVGTDAFTEGAPAFHRAADNLVTSTATGNTRIGVAIAAAGNPSPSVKVRLNGSF